jgi:hypothetical protein
MSGTDRVPAGFPEIRGTHEKATDNMSHDSTTASVLTGAVTTITPRDWFAGAGDDHDHSIRSWIPDEAGYLSTVCGRLSAHAGRIVNRPCPACQAVTRALSARPGEQRMSPDRLGPSARREGPHRVQKDWLRAIG